MPLTKQEPCQFYVVVFIDDFEGNIDAAQRLGLQGVLVEEDFAPSIAETRRLLG